MFSTQEMANLLKISKSTKLLEKMKYVSFILHKKPYGLLVSPASHYNERTPLQYLQITYLIWYLYPECANNSYNSKIRQYNF